MTKFEVFSENDLDHLVSLLSEFQGYLNKMDGIPDTDLSIYDGIKYRKDLVNHIKDLNLLVFLIKNEEKSIGYFYLRKIYNIRRGRFDLHLVDLFVSPSFQGKGVGTETINFIKNFAKANGCFSLKLNSGLNLVDAHKFYEKNGGRFTEKHFRFEV